MKPPRLSLALALCAILALPSAPAANQIKANTTTTLAAADWGGTMPGTADIGEFNNVISAANALGVTIDAGAGLSVGGLKFDNNLPGPVVFLSGGGILTLNTLNGTNLDLSTTNNDVTINAPVVLANNQIWTVNTGKTLTINGTITGTGITLTKSSNPGNLVIASTGNAFAALTLNLGQVTLNNSATMTLTGATYLEGGNASPIMLDVNNATFTTASMTTRDGQVVVEGTTGSIVMGGTLTMGTGDGRKSAIYLKNSGSIYGTSSTPKALSMGAGYTQQDTYFKLQDNTTASFSTAAVLNSANYCDGHGHGSVLELQDSSALTTTSDAFVVQNASDNGRSGTLYAYGQIYQHGGTLTVGGSLKLADNINAPSAGNGSGPTIFKVVAAYNLNSGTLKVAGQILGGNSSANYGLPFLNFHGGTLVYTGTTTQTDFINLSKTTGAYGKNGTANARIWESATIDTGAKDVTIAQSLMAPSGQGVSAIAITNLPTPNYVYYNNVPPWVYIDGGGGTGATAVATLDPATGKVNAIVVTNPGNNYTSKPTIELVRNDLIQTISAVDITLTTNTTGGSGAYHGDLAKLGSGTLTLSGVNTYAGTTTVSVGALAITNGYSLGAGPLVVAPGATVSLSNVSPAFVASLSLGGNAKANGTWGATGSAAANIDDTYFVGTGILTVGTGTTTATTLVTSGTPSVYGSSLTFTATVAPTPTGGTVQFYDNGAALASAVTVNTSTGQASYATNGLLVGSHTISATYSGTTGYVTSANTGIPQTVTQRPVTLTGTKVYDGTATIAGASMSVSNAVGSETVNLGSTFGILSGANVGSRTLSATNPVLRVQSATGSTGAVADVTLPVTLGSAPLNGNTLVAVISTRGTSAGRVSGISGGGVSWSRVSQSTGTAGTTTEIWYGPNVSAGTTAITITQGSLLSAAVVVEYGGLLTPTSFDVAGNNAGNSAAAVTGTSANTQQGSAELCVGGIGLVDSTYTLSGILNSFVPVANAASTSVTTNTNSVVYALEGVVTTSGAGLSSGGTVSTSSQWSGAIATFRAVPVSPVVRVQSATGNTGASASTSFSVTLGATPVTGNTLIAVISTRAVSTQNAVSTITGGGVNWSRQRAAGSVTVNSAEIWYGTPVATGTTAIIITTAASVFAAAVVMEYTGVLAGTESQADAQNVGTALLTGGNNTSQANELWIGGFGLVDSTYTLSTFTAGFTPVANTASASATASDNSAVYAIEKIVNATGNTQGGATLSTSSRWAACVVAFKAKQLTLAGANAANYTLAGMTGSVAVTAQPLSVTAPLIADKPYDGSPAAAAVTVGTLSGFVATETVSTTATAANYPSAAAGTYPGTVITYTLHDGTNGGLAANYSLANGTATGTITGGNSYITWASTHAGGQAANLDFDKDGIPNGVEYFMGAPVGVTANPSVVTASGVRTVTWPRNAANGVTSWLVQVSDNLVTWTNVVPPNSSIDTADPSKVVFTLPSGPTKFCRLVVTP